MADAQLTGSVIRMLGKLGRVERGGKFAKLAFGCRRDHQFETVGAAQDGSIGHDVWML